MSKKQDDKYLILKGCAGLGNRLFTIFSALSYCELSNRKLFIDWSDGQFGNKNKNVFRDYFFIDHPLYIEKLPLDINQTNDIYPKLWIGNLSKSIYDALV